MGLQDVTDLFGADLPEEGGKGGAFAWRDGPFLQALKAGHWVVFDEVCLCFIVLHPVCSVRLFHCYSPVHYPVGSVRHQIFPAVDRIPSVEKPQGPFLRLKFFTKL